jgi:hypothetical protein
LLVWWGGGWGGGGGGGGGPGGQQLHPTQPTPRPSRCGRLLQQQHGLALFGRIVLAPPHKQLFGSECPKKGLSS